MSTSNYQSLSFSLDLGSDTITKLRFTYPQSGYDTHDSVSLQSITLSNSTQNESSFLYFDRVNGKDQNNKTSTAASDYGLYLNSGVTGANPGNNAGFGYDLDIDSLSIDGAELSKYSDNISINLELHELNKFDGSVLINFQAWFEELGDWKDIGTISTTDKKEANADWQQITNLPNPQPPIIGYDEDLPIPTPPLNDENILEIKQPENKKNVGDFIANENVSWALDGVDSGLFEINPDGDLEFKTAPDFENPTDSGKDNNYDLSVIATDSDSEVTTQQVTIQVEDEDESPIIGYDGELPIPTPPLNDEKVLEIKQPENKKNVGDFIANENVGWTLDGVDSGLFEITPDGDLKFKTAPDYENPTDNGKDNNYDLNVIATDANFESTTQPVAIEVTDESECEIVIEGEGTNNETLKFSSDASCLDESIWLSISLTDSLAGKLTNNDWVGVNILNDEGTVIKLNGLGHEYTDNNQEVLSNKPLLVKLEANESLQLTQLNPPQVGGEELRSVDFTILDAVDFEAKAILGDELVLNIEKLDEEPSRWDANQESLQNTPAEGIFDFSDLGDRRDFKVTLSGDGKYINTVGVVKVVQSNNSFSVNGVSSDEGADFLDAVKSNIQGFNGVLPSVGGGVYEKEFNWSVDDQDEGLYALAMISQTGEVYTFGTDTSADGKQHIKELGSWTWGFEDMIASKADWDYNDTIVKISQA
jgi:hypothetical protein